MANMPQQSLTARHSQHKAEADRNQPHFMHIVLEKQQEVQILNSKLCAQRQSKPIWSPLQGYKLLSEGQNALRFSRMVGEQDSPILFAFEQAAVLDSQQFQVRKLKTVLHFLW